MSGRYSIAVVRKAMRVLDALAGRKDPATLTSIATEVDLPKDQTFRILITLQEDRLTDRVADRWIVGVKLIAIGHKAALNRLAY